MFLEVENVSMVYHHSRSGQILSLGRILLGLSQISDGIQGTVNAVDDVSLHIRQGERVGIVGSNGAGKSTLLQIMAGLIHPTSGTVNVEGDVTCIMTLGVGLREDLSGRENIYVDGEINGKTRYELNAVIDEIIEFAELDEFIDYPIRTYSSGMKARLAFSMITFISPEILIVDEALGAGDARFGQKASKKMRELCDKGGILVLVSHSMASIVDMCNRCVWLDKGRIVMDGSPKKVTDAYLDHIHWLDNRKMVQQFSRLISSSSAETDYTICELDFVDVRGRSKLVFQVGEDILLRIRVNALKRIETPDFRVRIERMDGITLIDNTASGDGFQCGPIEGEAEIEVPFGSLCLGKHKFAVLVDLIDNSIVGSKVLASRSTVLSIENPHYPYENPVTYRPAKWSIGHVE